jgi:hypothetical protein
MRLWIKNSKQMEILKKKRKEGREGRKMGRKEEK